MQSRLDQNTFLTPAESAKFRDRPCNYCRDLKPDNIALFGYCMKFKVWNPLGNICERAKFTC